jgi:PAS domain S-box-containing protein/putative nucleotidyltransferase with HDIG domain
MTTPLRLLLVEDVEDDCLLTVADLRRRGYQLDYTRVETREAMAALLAQREWDAILSDFSLPQLDAPTALRLLQESGLDLPFIIVSGTITEESAVTALRAGAHDFITKGNLARLAPALERELRAAQDRRDRRLAEAAQLRQAASFKLLFANNPHPMWVFDDDSLAVVEVNDAAVARYGYTRDEFQTMQVTDLHPAADVPRLLDDLRGAPSHAAEGQRWQHRRKDGTLIDVDVVATRMEVEGRQVRLVVAHDVTQRVKAEQALLRQLARLAGLHSIDVAIAGSVDMRFTLNVILEQVAALLEVDAVAVLLLDPSRQVLSYSSVRGVNSKALLATEVPWGSGAAGRALRDRRTAQAPNLAEDRDDPRAKYLTAQGLVSCVAVPLTSKGQVLGVLEVYARGAVSRDEDWASFLETLAGQTAIALENASLFDGLSRSNARLSLAYEATIAGWAHALDLRDRETEGHSQRVTTLAVRLARALGLDEGEMAHLRRGALLHDIGKMGIPDGILLKPGPLTDAEWEIMRQHPVLAHDWLSRIDFLRAALDIPYCHHERWDGTGYPRGLAGEQIPLSARVFAAVDVWDALRSDRPYRAAWDAPTVRAHLNRLAGTHFDPRVVEAFLEMEIVEEMYPTP